MVKIYLWNIQNCVEMAITVAKTIHNFDEAGLSKPLSSKIIPPNMTTLCICVFNDWSGLKNNLHLWSDGTLWRWSDGSLLKWQLLVEVNIHGGFACKHSSNKNTRNIKANWNVKSILPKYSYFTLQKENSCKSTKNLPI